jgi:hypothetical protein
MERFARAQARQGVSWLNASVIEPLNILAVLVLLLTVALFAAMIWAGNHQH